jgi:hypothetical protein
MTLPHDDAPSDFLRTAFVTTSEKITGAISTVAITSPLWLQQLKPYSDVAAVFAPILGCIYLSLQIGFKLWDRSRKED